MKIALSMCAIFGFVNLFDAGLGQTNEEVTFTFTPDSLTADFGFVTLLRDDAIVNNDRWEMQGDSNEDPILMAISATVLAGTDCEINDFEIEFDASCTTGECDGAIVIQAGSEYISYIFDFDGGVYVKEGLIAGTAIYPACGSNTLPEIPNDSTNVNDLFDPAYDTNDEDGSIGPGGSFDDWRDGLAGGNRDNWNAWDEDRVGYQDGFTVGFTLDEDTNTMIVGFEAGSYSVTCTLDTIFSFQNGNDIIVSFSPDMDELEYWYINSLTVTTDCSAGSFAEPSGVPTMVPTGAPTFTACKEPCINDPCQCDNVDSTDFDENCDICHSNGCSRCFEEDGWFKQDYNYPCQQCQESFGEGCLHCQDFNGCAQCDEANGYYIISCQELFGEGKGCDMNCCEYRPQPSPAPTPEDVNIVCPNVCNDDDTICPCDENEYCIDSQCLTCGCNECQDGYFYKSFAHACVSCVETFGNQCLKCTNWQGCTECDVGYAPAYDSECGLLYCKQD